MTNYALILPNHDVKSFVIHRLIHSKWSITYSNKTYLICSFVFNREDTYYGVEGLVYNLKKVATVIQHYVKNH